MRQHKEQQELQTRAHLNVFEVRCHDIRTVCRLRQRRARCRNLQPSTLISQNCCHAFPQTHCQTEMLLLLVMGDQVSTHFLVHCLKQGRWGMVGY